MFIYGRYRKEEDAQRAVDELVEAEFLPSHITAITPVGERVETVRPVDRPTVSVGAPLGILIGFTAGIALAAATGGISLMAAGIGGAVVGVGLGLLAALGLWKVRLELPAEREQAPLLVGVDTATRADEAAAALHKGAPDYVGHYAVRAMAINDVRAAA